MYNNLSHIYSKPFQINLSKYSDDIADFGN